MKAVAKISFDRNYFETFYSNWLDYRSRWRRYAIPFAIAFLIAAFAAAVLSPMPYSAMAFPFVFVAVFNMVDAATYKMRWIRKRLVSNAVDKTAELVFTDDDIRISSQNSEGTVKYAAFGSMNVTPNGIFLVPDSGVSIFVPRSSFLIDDEFHSVSAKLAGLAPRRKTRE